ncbi:hypothetical protein DXG01_010741 [Tephrocybe rancida]|nr:hypothetical protein DXG01_010741 [Tephrocybe rancida]
MEPVPRLAYSIPSKMVFLNKLLSSVYLAVVYASVTSASSKHSTHRTRTIGRRGFQVDTFHPETKFQTFGAGLDQPASFAPLSLSQAAVEFVKSHLGVDEDSVAYKSGYTTQDTKIAYAKQAFEGVPFANAVANVAFKGNKVVSFGSSFVGTNNIAPSTPSISVESIIPAAEEALDGTYNGHPTSIEYLAREDGSVALTHVLQIQNEETGTWYEAFVDAHTGEILSVTNFVSDATYKVLPITKETFPEGLEILVDPQDTFSSPSAWHDDGSTQTNNTSGNNVVAYKGTQTNVTVQSAPDLVFNYTYNDALAPTEGENIDAARTNAFYIINTVHDFAYRYGFTESSFNFQTNNFDKGGKGNDRVLMSVQDASGTNNANFATPADGQSGTCRMYLWTRTTVRRDGALENDIITHEMTHGITNRMTGGGTGRCLQTTEAGGMGEGWSDAMAEYALALTCFSNAAHSDWKVDRAELSVSAVLLNVTLFSDRTTNPLRYSSIAALNEVHNIGEVWANMLHNVYAALVTEYGFNSEAKTTPEATEGNVVFLHLFIDALALQPCNPTFVSARDAWIQADVNRYSGVNECLLWKAFASRGLGVNAAKFVDDSTVPPASEENQIKSKPGSHIGPKYYGLYSKPHVKELENERLKLVPFIPSRHLDPFFAIPRPSYEHFPWGPFLTADQFHSTLIQGRIQPSQSCVLFAIYDKTKAPETGDADGAIAGVIGLCDASAVNLHAEIAFVMISPKFQRTHVTTNATGLLMHWVLDLPSEGGLGLRRMVWKASPLNAASIKAAERMGFTKEGILRWHWVLPVGKEAGGNGKERRAGDPRESALGRDTVVLSLCWDDWENFGRANVDEAIARTA